MVIPPRELTYPTLERGKSSTQICQKSGGYVNSLEGIWCCHFVTADAGSEMSDTCTEMCGINTTNKVRDVYGIVLNLQQKVLTHSPSCTSSTLLPISFFQRVKDTRCSLPQETEEWLESLEALLSTHGAELIGHHTELLSEHHVLQFCQSIFEEVCFTSVTFVDCQFTLYTP